MAVNRWHPFRDMLTMQQTMDRLFDDLWQSGFGAAEASSIAFDIHESDTAYIVAANVPGLVADQIDVQLRDNVLTISFELPQPTLAEGERVLLQERRFGRFSRSITLPQAIDTEAVEAQHNNGVLTLTLPKEPSAQPKRITIQQKETPALTTG